MNNTLDFLEQNARESFIWKNPEIKNIIKNWYRVNDELDDDSCQLLLFKYLWNKFEIKPPYNKDVFIEKEKTIIKNWQIYCIKHNIKNLGYFEFNTTPANPDLRGTYKLKESNEKYLWICSPVQSVEKYCLRRGYCGAADIYHKAYPIVAVPESFANKICNLKAFEKSF